MYHNLILFDGVCNFCNTAVQTVIKFDNQKIFKFAAIQSKLGQQLYHQHGLDPVDIQTLMFVDGDIILTKSDAVLAVLARLDGGWQLLSGFSAMPQPLRDWAYTEFARQRFLAIWTTRNLYGSHSRCARAVYLGMKDEPTTGSRGSECKVCLRRLRCLY